jgi:chemotaxis protein CheX
VNPALTERKQGIVSTDASWAILMASSTREVFQRMVGIDVTHVAQPAGAPSGSVSALVGMAGAISSVVRVRCTPETARRVATKMLGGAAGPEASEWADAMGEIANMVAGNFKSKITELSDGCVLSVPTIVTGDDYEVHQIGRGERIEVCLDYEGEPIWITMDISN